MNDKIKALPDDALVRLKLQVDAEFKARSRKLFGTGRQATFYSEKHDKDVRILITGRGPKNIIGVQCDEYGNKIGNAQWRVHPSFLMPALPKPKPVEAPVGIGKDAPATAAGAW